MIEWILFLWESLLQDFLFFGSKLSKNFFFDLFDPAKALLKPFGWSLSVEGFFAALSSGL